MRNIKVATVNSITVSRIGVAAAMVICRDDLSIFTALLLVGLLTDIIDGNLARYWQVATPIGKLLDTIADGAWLLATVICLFMRGWIPVQAALVYIVGCWILIAITHEKCGQRWLSVKIWARIGLAWFWFAVVLDSGVILVLVWMSYSTATAIALTVIGLIGLRIGLRSPIQWRDGYLKAISRAQQQ